MWLRRVPVLILVLAVPLLVGALDRTHATHHLVNWLCSYSPSRLVHGAVWTLPASALLEAQPAKLGPNTLVPTLIFAPYLLWVGALPAIKTFFVGHVVATLTAASALGVLLWHTKARPLAAVVLGVVLVLFTYRLASESLGATLADGEHLVAIATGVLIELRRRAVATVPRTPVPARVAGAPRA
jgi:hypothetical protein